MKKRNFLILFFLIICLTFGLYYYNINSKEVRGVEIINLDKNNKKLLFYGSNHSNDIDSPMFKDIEKNFNRIKPQVVLVEGDFNAIKYADMYEAIEKGESAYVSYLAQQKDIPLQSVEPSMRRQYDILLEKYSKEDVLLMYVLRQLYQFQRESSVQNMDFEQKLERYLDVMANQGFPFSSEEILLKKVLALLKEHLNADIDSSNWMDINYYDLIYRSGTKLNRIYSEVLNIRNQHLLSVIEDSLNKYDRVFVIMGADHVKTQRKNIENIFLIQQDKTKY
ncbi:hypothetical protein OXPF_01880 [Oxobacter pfennigii]|uniref:TraB family protein n=1 Tax=Oxobacter pfennigii TaxID=36849 RepID=A0A0P8WTU1_9CLOT|nr:hypothetical protein [Oxobacter pfennigii]KPU46078.1 hypothetical protein OXPF_01880 [Oxobacter pfennigii]